VSLRKVISFLWILALVAGGLAFLIFDRPPSATWKPAAVLIPKGVSSAEAARLLSAENVLRHPVAFRLLATATMTTRRLRFGEYSFPDPPSAFEIWKKLQSGDVTRYPVTIPEGSNLYDIAEILKGKGLADPAAFLAAAAKPDTLRRLEIPGATAEGFLFPDTYQLVKSMSCEDILEAMVSQFNRKVPAEWVEKGKKEGFSLLQIVTMASIIEKETGVEEEKPLVSAVIRNRLAIGMPLQMDPTVIYGLRKFGTDLSRKDLLVPSPYNSYLNRDLPPGPITNPGLSAIRAAVFPESADYLYFVSRRDGSHKFSRTLDEHNVAVVRYRKD
jgi:UPF0755 protein